MLIRSGFLAATLAAGVIAIGVLSPNAQSEVPATVAPNAFKIDTVHSSVIFRIKHMQAAWFYGRFDELTGTINYDAADPTASSLNLAVKIDSVNSGNARRNGHLKSGDFFNSAQFPTSTFVSTSFARASENTYEVAGDLTMNGTTRPITVRLEKTGEVAAQGAKIIGFEAIFDIKRSDFGITYGMENLGDEVRMIVSMEAKKD